MAHYEARLTAGVSEASGAMPGVLLVGGGGEGGGWRKSRRVDLGLGCVSEEVGGHEF